MKKYQSLTNINFQQQCLLELNKYGSIQESRTFDIEIEGKNRKFIKLVSDQSRLDLVEALKNITNYSFFFFEGEYFHCKHHVQKRKKDIYYNSQELDFKEFFLSLLHEVGHFPRICELDEIGNEKLARIKAIKTATALKNQYNFCCLAGFQGYNDVYSYIERNISTYI